MFKYLCIGDPHFQNDFLLEANVAIDKLVEAVKIIKPDFIVILGDILHKCEKIDMQPKYVADKCISELSKLSDHLYLLIGNHDRLNNSDFLTDIHAF